MLHASERQTLRLEEKQTAELDQQSNPIERLLDLVQLSRSLCPAAGWLESVSECRCVGLVEIEEAPDDDGKWGSLVLPMFYQ